MIEDPKRDRQKKHLFSDIFFITLYAAICGADNWVAIERFGKAKEQWFTKQLNLEYGVPSYDTLVDVFALIDTEQFSQCFSNWVVDLSDLAEEAMITIDVNCLSLKIGFLKTS